MKSIPLIFSFLLISVVGFGQGNLQFNRVFTWKGTVSITPSNAYVGVHSGPTIPNGKVWKIEQASLTRADVPNPSILFFGGTNYSIIINGTVLTEQSSNTNNLISNESIPVWLEPGTFPVTVFAQYVGENSFTIALNIIEYNIIP